MMKKQTIESLCFSLKNEDIHSQYVCSMALSIFDTIYPFEALPTKLRPLLKAAALLHDIGYASNPFDHQAESAWLIVKKGIESFSDEDCAVVAATVLLHRKDYKKAFSFPLFKDIAIKKKALLLGAILRIADGLDHGHIQNTKIVSFTKTDSGYVCICDCPGYEGSIPWAIGKSDLWARVFSAPIIIQKQSTHAPADKFAGILNADDTVLEALRKFLFLQYRIITENTRPMLEAKSDVPLHDVRIALRRFRSALRLFSPFLKSPVVLQLDKQCARFSLGLSPLRDNDVWMDLLQTFYMNTPLMPEYDAFYKNQLRLKKHDSIVLRTLVKSEEYSAFLRSIIRFLRVELPHKIKTQARVGVFGFCAQQLFCIYFEIFSRPMVKKDYDVEKMHRVRKLCRKGRYWAELMAPIIGNPAHTLAKLFKSLADSLGDMHDADTMLERLAQLSWPKSKALSDILKAKKRECYDHYKKSWERLHSPDVFTLVKNLPSSWNNAFSFLYFVRHADALADMHDFQRPLSKKGIGQSESLSTFFACTGMPVQALITSPALRCVQTSEKLLFKHAQGIPAITIPYLGGAKSADLLLYSWLAKSNYKTMVLVGHEPQLTRIIRLLLRNPSKKLTFLKKGSLCMVFFDGPVLKRSGTMQLHLSNKQLKRINDKLSIN